jgi:hypothetical protein
LSGVLRRPFPEQVAFFRGKLGNLVPTARWDDLWEQEHDTAFMVAGAQKAELLADLAASVDRAIAEGKSLDGFRRDFAAAVERNDWHGWTGEDTAAGRAWRTRTIYRTNASTSYAAGRRAQLEAGKFPFWVYRHGGSRDPRPEHLALDGLVLPSDDPAWAWLYPPSDWGCSCYVVGARTLAGARRLGGDPDKKPPAWFGKIDRRTGAPVGVGKGWAYAPGARVAGTVQAVTAKSAGWRYEIAKAFMASVPPETRDLLAASYRTLPSVADDVRLYAARVIRTGEAGTDVRRTLGPLTSVEARAVGDLLGERLDGFDWSVSEDAVRHVLDAHGTEATEAPRGQRAVTAADYARLPAILFRPESIARVPDSESGEKLVELTRLFDEELTTAVYAYLSRRRTMVLKTLFVRRRSGKARTP